GGAGSRYGAALEWWARYLAIVFRAGLPEWRERYWGHGYYPTILPLERYADAVKIARGDDDRARAQFLFARAWMNNGGDRRAAEGIVKALEEVVALGKRSEWYDDALFALAQFHEQQGSFVREEGNLVRKPDYAKALAGYRRLLEEFKKGESRYVDECRGRIEQITAPQLEVLVERFFLPGSEVQYRLAWRNLASVALELVPVDLVNDVTLSENEDWLQRLPLTRAAAQTFEHATGDAGRHEPGNAALLLPKKPEPGAYVLRARAGKLEQRALVLVTDVSVTIKTSPAKLLAWATDARTGRPIEGADVRFFDNGWDGTWRVRDARAKTGKDGVALFERAPTIPNRNHGYFVALSAGGRPSYALGWMPGREDEARTWQIYAYADRAAYRPLDTVQWKFWARTRGAGAYATPANETVTWVLSDPQGSVVQEGTSTLNAFGAAWGSFATTSAMTLGEYQLAFFRDAAKNEHIGQTTLFRLEEYKLPEFEVAVKTPRDEQGRPKLFRMGDRVEVELEAAYLYGAPVAGATVEVFVHQKPRYRPLGKRREFPWLYDDSQPGRWWGGQGQQILHESKNTDA
ncbi:MAG: MG2 domain-containing protein, partial [Planctomycetota bacterium]